MFVVLLGQCSVRYWYQNGEVAVLVAQFFAYGVSQTVCDSA